MLVVFFICVLQLMALTCYCCIPGQFVCTQGCCSCQPGTYCPDGVNVVSCSPGTYNPNIEWITPSACSACGPGTYSGTGWALCNPCPAGTFSGTGQASCDACSPGSYSGTRQSSCDSCSPGTYSGGGSGICNICGPGTYSGNGQGSCTSCSSGTYSGSGQASCTTCSSGSYSGSGQASCTLCGPGTYGPSAGATSSSACVACRPGTYNPNCGSTTVSSCLVTLPGTFTNTAGSSSLQMCAAGTYAAGYASTGCAPCPSGQYCSTSSSGQCTPCPIGTYGVATGGRNSSVCLQCGAGTYGTVGGAASPSACVACLAGTYSTSQGALSASSCRQCPPGTFGTTPGASSAAQCLSCQAGSYTAYPGANTCDLCDAGTYSPAIGAKAYATCLPCPPGTWSTSIGANSSTSCLPCARGTSNPSSGSFSCVPCGPGSYSDSVGAVMCLPCPQGTYGPTTGANSLLSCTVCPAGTYGLNTAASTSQSCIPCSAGQYSPQVGATSFTTCRQCAAGTFTNGSGSVICIGCPVGTSSSVIGSVSERTCTACDFGSYNNITGQSICLPCPPATFQNESGQTECQPCPAGTSASLEGLAACDMCLPGYYAPTTGLAKCLLCPPGMLQLASGGTSCSVCPSEFVDLPALMNVSPYTTSVCGGLTETVAINWGPLVSPAQLAAALLITANDGEGIPDWLTVRVSGWKVVVFTSDIVPSAAVLNKTLNITLTITHTCRALPWVGTITFNFVRSDPVMIPRSSSGNALACPDFDLQYTLLLGSCASQITVVPMLENRSSLPSFITYANSGGLLHIVGTVPTGTTPFAVIVVAFLGHETFLSSSAIITLASPAPIQISTSTTSMEACPFVSVDFRLVRSDSCSKLRVWASLANGSALPSFLNTATNGSPQAVSLSVSGILPEGYPDIMIIAWAATGGGIVHNSSAVTVTRPKLASTANASIRLSGADNSTSIVSSIGLLPLKLFAAYGTPLHCAVSIDTGTEQMCPSLSLVLSSLEPNTSGSPALHIPAWISVAALSPFSALISANPTADVPSGTAIVLYVWVKDGLRNPGFILTIVTKQSLLLLENESRSRLPVVQTPASMLQMHIEANLLTAHAMFRPFLICPLGATTSGFCSASSDGSSVGAFGTPAGINAIFQELSVSLPQDDLGFRSVTLWVSFKDSVNPDGVQTVVPLSDIRAYSGVRQVRALNLTGTVGKHLAMAIGEFFTADSTLTIITYIFFCNSSWLTLLGGIIGGTPQGPPDVVPFIIVASDKYTKVTTSGNINISWPMVPVVNTQLALSHWYVVSGNQLDVLLPPDVIVDPENGTILFDLLEYTGSTDLQALPMFVSFDANNLRMTGTPAASDVGMYALVLIGTTQWGSWKGNATVLLSVTVTQSWSDFFVWVYSIAGYCASALGVVTWCLLYRSQLINMLLFHKRLRTAAPEAFLVGGSYTLHFADGERQIPSEQVKHVSITYIERSAVNRSFAPAYLLMKARLTGEKLKADAITGVPWARVFPTRMKTIELVIDIPMVQQLVESGKIFPGDEYYVEVISTGAWWSGTVLEAFTFQVDCFLHDFRGGVAINANVSAPSFEAATSDVSDLQKIVEDDDAELELIIDGDDSSSSSAVGQHVGPEKYWKKDSAGDEQRLDPYTGRPAYAAPCDILQQQAPEL